MANKLNVEIKAKCTNPEKIRKILDSLNAKYVGRDHQIDTYFNIENGRLKLRKGKIENSLIFYSRQNKKGPKESDVALATLEANNELKSVLEKSIGIRVEVDKKRHIYFVDNVKFHVDEVKNLGSFVEIEAIDEDGSIGQKKLLKQCKKYMSLFGIQKEDLIDCSYSDLIEKKKKRKDFIDESILEKSDYGDVRLIKKFKNRKLYDTTLSGYVTLTSILGLIEKGEKLVIIDHESGRDITSVVLKTHTPKEDKNLKKISEDKFDALVAKVMKKKKIDQEINFVDLFCGMGGISCGLEMAGLNCVFGNDANIDALNTFRKNHPRAATYSGSVWNIDEKLLKEKIGDKKVHLVVGGPPCQGFSTIGKGDPGDMRNSLFQHYCNVVDILRPEFLIFENVTGLLARKNQDVLNIILNRFSELGYKVIAKVLESQHYGVPQKRKRAILFGTRLNKNLSFPTPLFDTNVGEEFVPCRTLGDALLEIDNYDGNLHNHNKKSAEIKKEIVKKQLDYIPEGRGIRYKKDEDELLPKHLKLDVDWETIREGRLRELTLRRLDRKEPSPTVNTQNHHYYHPTETRRFTAREFASIQSFPVDFEMTGKHNSLVKQVGNAVPPLMAKAIGEKIIEIYNSVDVDENTKDTVDVEEIRMSAFTYDNFKSLRKFQEGRV